MTPPPLVHRHGTSDEAIWRGILESNEYRLPDRLDGAVVIDIGTHIGPFSFMVLQRGASMCYSYEADPILAKIAGVNLHQFGPRSMVLNRPVWGYDKRIRFISAESPHNTGLGRVWDRGGDEIDAVAIDKVLLNASEHGKRDIDILKLDCEGSEWSILHHAIRLPLVRRIVGEFHENFISAAARAETGADLGRDWLLQVLDGKGFDAEIVPSTHPKAGHFFAERRA